MSCDLDPDSFFFQINHADGYFDIINLTHSWPWLLAAQFMVKIFTFIKKLENNIWFSTKNQSPTPIPTISLNASTKPRDKKRKHQKMLSNIECPSTHPKVLVIFLAPLSDIEPITFPEMFSAFISTFGVTYHIRIDHRWALVPWHWITCPGL